MGFHINFLELINGLGQYPENGTNIDSANVLWAVALLSPRVSMIRSFQLTCNVLLLFCLYSEGHHKIRIYAKIPVCVMLAEFLQR